MNDIKENITCDACGETTETKFVSKSFKRKGQTFSFQNVKAQVCPNCGERYFDGKTMLAIEKEMKAGLEKIAA